VPELKEALLTGDLSVSKARYILPALTETEDPKPWIEKAIHDTQEQVEKEVKAKYPSPIPREKIKRVTDERFSVQLSLTEEEKKLLDRVRELMVGKIEPPVNLQGVFTRLLKEYLHRHDPLIKAQRNDSLRRVKAAKESKTVSASVGHALQLRDAGRCTYVGPLGNRCEATCFIQTHHLQHRAHGGDHTLENLTLLCSRHHRFVHH